LHVVVPPKTIASSFRATTGIVLRIFWWSGVILRRISTFLNTLIFFWRVEMFQRIRDLLGNLTRFPINKRGILVCPRCGSKKIRLWNSISGFITPPYYFCQNCHYSGYFIVEVDKEGDSEGSF